MSIWIKQKGGRPAKDPYMTPIKQVRLKTYLTNPIKYDRTLQVIFHKFIAPLINALGFVTNETDLESDNIYNSLEHIFNTNYRSIFSYRVKRNIITMPGEYYIADGISAPYGPKKVFTKGYRLLIVADKRRPDDVKVEFFKNWGDKEGFMYRLTKKELATIMEYIEPLDRHKERVKKQKRESRQRLKKQK